MKFYFNQKIKEKSAPEFIDNLFDIVDLLKDKDPNLKVTSRSIQGKKTTDVYFEIKVDKINLGKVTIPSLLDKGLYLMSNERE